ncbi:MAG: sugar phosphate isomerase/epimerase [Roseburia sp.]|nr:sugar phosphate isomerase/epimerase [Roseburia sp.]
MLEKCKITGFADEIASSFDEQLEVLKELGQNFLELRGADGIGVSDISMTKALELKKKMSEQGVGVSAIGSPIGKIGIEDDFEEHFESFRHIVELAHCFNTPYIRMFSFYLPDEKNPEAFRGQVFERIGKLIDYAAREEVVLLHENEKGIYGARAAQCKNLFDAFYGEHFRGIFDFANFIQCGQDTREAYALLEDSIAYIHVKDAVRSSGEVVLPGEGDGALQEIFRRLEERGFSGYLSLEPHLFHFAGLDRLEKNPEAKKEKSGVRAYKAAYHSLQTLLKEN